MSALTLASNARFLMSGGVNGEVRVWELRTRQLIATLKEHAMAVTEIV